MVKKDEVIAKVKVIPELGTLNSAESRLRLADDKTAGRLRQTSPA